LSEPSLTYIAKQNLWFIFAAGAIVIAGRAEELPKYGREWAKNPIWWKIYAWR